MFQLTIDGVVYHTFVITVMNLSVP